MGEFRLLEHTADMGIEACAGSREGLFVAAAQGLMEILGSRAKGQPDEKRSLHLTGDDPGELMVTWLSEILFLVEKGFLPHEFVITRADDNELEASISGQPRDLREGEFVREVKAITYHQLRVERAGGSWRARIFVDL